MYLGGEEDVYNNDGTVTITSIYGASDTHTCSLSSGDYNGVVAVTNSSTHNADMSVVGEISFLMAGTNFSYIGTGTFTGMIDYDILYGTHSDIIPQGLILKIISMRFLLYMSQDG